MIITRDQNKSHQVIDRLITNTIQSDAITSDQITSDTQLIENTSNATNTVQYPLKITTLSNNTVADGFGCGIKLTAQRNSLGDRQDYTGLIQSYGNTLPSSSDRWNMKFIVRDNDTDRTPLILKNDNTCQIQSIDTDGSNLEIKNDIDLRGTNRSVWIYGDNTRNLRLHCASDGTAYFDLSGYKKWIFRSYTTTTRAQIKENGEFNQLSDDRMKENEQIIQNGLEVCCKIKPQIYQKKDEMDSTDTSKWETESGVIAQQLYYDIPELRHLVYTESTPDENIEIPDDPTQDPDYSSWGEQPAMVNYIGLIPYLISAVKELKAEIDTLKNP